MEKKDMKKTRPWYHKKRYLIPLVVVVAIPIILMMTDTLTPYQIGKFLLVLLICWATEPIVEKLFK